MPSRPDATRWVIEFGESLTREGDLGLLRPFARRLGGQHWAQRQTEGQTEGQTERQTESDREKGTDE